MLQRRIYSRLLGWKTNSAGRIAVLIEGARRVGKPTIAESFAKNEYEDYLILNYALESEAVKGNFSNLSNLDEFFRNLFLLKRKVLQRSFP